MRVKYIDVLKAIAIFAVVLYHTGILDYGYLGVDIFLVIAGYLTTRSLVIKWIFEISKKEGSNRQTSIEIENKTSIFNCWRNYFEFELSRIIRLLPSILAAGIICMIVGYFVMLPDDYENLSQSVIASNFFGNNILSAITTKDYWDVVNEYKPMMHTWYVGVLMQFYIIYPIFFLLAKLNRQNAMGTLFTLIGTFGLISLLIYFRTENATYRFYYLTPRFFEFAVGGIIAIVKNPANGTTFNKAFTFVSYILLLAFIIINAEILPTNIRLVVIVTLSAILLCAQDVLENKVTGNAMLSKIGAASYSIFIWHQVLLAFCRYIFTSNFNIWTYSGLFLTTTLISFCSYNVIEQIINKSLKLNREKKILLGTIIASFIVLNVFSVYIYMNAGVIRDVPELNISKRERHHEMHAQYVDRIIHYNKPFTTGKKHWLVIGNSFGRDFANVILESPITKEVEISYIKLSDYENPEYVERFMKADRVFLSSLGFDETDVNRLKEVCTTNGLPQNRLVIVGEKNFGECNGQIYVRRNRADYFKQRVSMEPGYEEKNIKMKNLYGDSYLDLIGLIIDIESKVPVFTPDMHYISADCRHFTRSGAKYFGKMIDWGKYLQ